MYELPTQIHLKSGAFDISNKGDYRMVLDCFKALNDPELDSSERVIATIMIFYKGIDSIVDLNKFGDEEGLKEAVEKMVSFFNCGTVPIGRTSRKVIDWEKDEQIIMAGVNQVACKELRAEPYCHWFTFMGYFSSIGESVLSTVVSIRSKMAKGKKLESYEQEFKKDNPEYFTWDSRTPEEIQMDEQLKALWNSNDEEVEILASSEDVN